MTLIYDIILYVYSLLIEFPTFMMETVRGTLDKSWILSLFSPISGHARDEVQERSQVIGP